MSNKYDKFLGFDVKSQSLKFVNVSFLNCIIWYELVFNILFYIEGYKNLESGFGDRILKIDNKYFLLRNDWYVI